MQDPIMDDRAYVRAKGLRCPFCRSSLVHWPGNLSHSLVHTNDPLQVNVETSCDACNRQWTEHYRLSGFSPTEV